MEMSIEMVGCDDEPDLTCEQVRTLVALIRSKPMAAILPQTSGFQQGLINVIDGFTLMNGAMK